MEIQTVSHVSDMLTMAEVLVQTGMLPTDINTKQKAFLLMQQGKELGLEPMQAINNIHVIKGKTAISSNMMLALIQKGGVRVKVTEWTDQECRIIFTRDGVDSPEVSYTMEDAKLAGFANKDNWKKYPKEMLKARAVAKGARTYCADLVQGMYDVDELKADVSSTEQLAETVAEVYESMDKRLEEADTEAKLDKVVAQIQKNQEIGLISDDDLKVLRGKYKSKLSEIQDEKDTRQPNISEVQGEKEPEGSQEVDSGKRTTDEGNESDEEGGEGMDTDA